MTHILVSEFCRQVDSLVIGASSESELRRKLGVLDRQSAGGWRLLRCPTWVGHTLVGVLIRPETEAECPPPEYFI